MACVGGSKSIGKTSKVDGKYKCNPCKQSRSIKDANMYCRNCDEFMCESCSSLHKAFKLSRGHVLDLVSDMGTAGRAGARKLSLQHCADHEDKLADSYCEKHEEIFCSSCRLTKHRTCNVVSVRDMAMAATSGQQLSAAIEQMTNMKSRIETLIGDREKDIKALTNLEKWCIADIQAFKTKLIELIERLERELLEDMKKVVEPRMAVLHEHVNTCGVLLPQVSADMNDVDNATSVDDHMTSVLVAHRLRKNRRTAETALAEIEPKLDRVNLTFVPAPTLSDCLTSVDRFGTLQVTPGLATSLSVSSDSLHVSMPLIDMQVVSSDSLHVSRPVDMQAVSSDSLHVSQPTDMQVVSSDSLHVSIPTGMQAVSHVSKPLIHMRVKRTTRIITESSSITGSAILADGKVVLVDQANNQVILLNKKMLTIKSKLKLADTPYDVAADVSGNVIVTLPWMQKLQWIDVGRRFRAGRTVTTDMSCYGVAVHAGEVYTTVEDILSDHVLVLDGRGEVKRQIRLDVRGNELFRSSHYITVSPRGLIFISNCDQHRVTCITPAGDVVYDTNLGDMRCTYGMLADDSGNLIVCCTNGIAVLRKDGSYRKTFLSSAERLKWPTSISYRRRDNTLIVTMMDNKLNCFAYKLK